MTKARRPRYRAILAVDDFGHRRVGIVRMSAQWPRRGTLTEVASSRSAVWAERICRLLNAQPRKGKQ